ncbi:MAG TPA: class I adenylate-forming enzyme family protein, partial [Acidimicrobiales bacterium]|nr:class I adenylate-forming enzyme family protein [Acidimicrobiales bacterium]
MTHQGRSTTFAELGEAIRTLAASYRALGIQPGDRIVTQLPDCPEHVAAIGAAWACGAVHVGADNDLTGDELAWLLDYTEAAAVLYRPHRDRQDPLGDLRTVAAACPKTRLVVHGWDPGPSELEVIDLAELLAGRHGTLPSAAPALEPDATAVLFLTSGTTGRPKGVMETLPVFWAKMQFFTDGFEPGPDDVHLIFLPISHVFGMRLALLALLRGGRVVLVDRFSPRRALELVAEEGVTVVPGMPTHLTLLVNELRRGSYDVATWRWTLSAAANISPDLVDAVYDEVGSQLLYVYGCSEGFTTQTSDRREITEGSVGSLVFAGPEGTAAAGTVAIADPESGAHLPAGEMGEIVFGSRVPIRYWRRPPVATDGWYRTGDLGRMDGEGRVYVLGRLKQVVNRGGLKVSPGEVEVALVQHPEVADAAVIATPDPVLGEATCACVVPAGASAPDLAAVREFLGASLARHKLPDELCLVEAVPRLS